MKGHGIPTRITQDHTHLGADLVHVIIVERRAEQRIVLNKGHSGSVIRNETQHTIFVTAERVRPGLFECGHSCAAGVLTNTFFEHYRREKKGANRA